MIAQRTFYRPGKPIVLVVEDDELLRALLIEVISEAGAFVEAVGTADAGLRAFEQCPAIDLIVTDVMTPGVLSGWDLAAAVYARKPELPVIITSGYSSALTPQLPGNACFLPKPWSLVQLTDLIKARVYLR
jgi:DNA-binding NtrC family response regulator